MLDCPQRDASEGHAGPERVSQLVERNGAHFGVRDRLLESADELERSRGLPDSG
jgi:hypothetical protein